MMSSVGHLLYRPYWYLLGGLVAANQLITEKALHESEAPSDLQSAWQGYGALAPRAEELHSMVVGGQ
jgi:hypothetical protein